MFAFDTIFGLAFDVERDPDRKSGFKPASYDLGSGKELFGDIRLDGFAALLLMGAAKRFIIVGGNEGRYKGETPTVNRAEAIRLMLIHDFGIDPALIEAIPSASNTGGNITIVREHGKGSFAVTSNLYHLPRAAMDMQAAGITAPMIATEAFWLLEDRSRKNLLIERLGGGPLAERMTEEVQGIADKLSGTYAPRTDVVPVKSWWWRLFA